MKKIAIEVLLLAAAAVCAQAQQWEFGGLGGGSFLNEVSVSAPSPAGSGNAGFATGGVVGAFLGQNISTHIAGEIRYEFFRTDLQLKGGGNSATWPGQAHAFHYDLLWHTHSADSSVQFFAAVGGGMKLFRGTGTEAAVLPMMQYGYFTKTHAVKPMGDFGGGVRFAVSKRVFLRVEIRDFITAFPTAVLTPPANVKYGSILNDIVPMADLSYVF